MQAKIRIVVAGQPEDAVIRWSMGATVASLSRRFGVAGVLHIDDRVVGAERALDDVLPDGAVVSWRPLGSVAPAGTIRRRVAIVAPRPSLEVDISVPAVAPSSRQSFPLASVLIPLGLSLLMALVFSPLMLIFGLLGPALAVARWVEHRRRSAAEFQRQNAARCAALDTARDEVFRQRDAYAAHIRSLRVPLPDLIDRVNEPQPRVWARRSPDRALEVCVGSGPIGIPWSTHADPEIRSLMERWDTIGGLPVCADLAQGPVGVIGEEEDRLAVGRAIAVQLALHLGPADLAVHRIAEEAPGGWRWWLPHPPADAGQFGDRAELFVGHAADYDHASPAVRRRIDSGEAAGVVVAAARDLLPEGCAWIVDCDGPELIDVGTGARHRLESVDGLTAEEACDIAHRLSRLLDPDESTSRSLAGVELCDLLHDRSHPGRDPAVRLTVGRDARGDIVTVDLVEDGPHALIAGTTGSGKSELLRTMVVSAANAAPPSRLAFVLIDFKGGGGLDVLGLLPHVAAVVTDLDERRARRALRSLRAEIRRREQLFSDHGCDDLGGLRASGIELPALVIVVDELATLVDSLPPFVSSLVDVAQRGRSLGLHLILATQRPSGVLDAHIKANTNLRICLRVQSDADSLDVIGCEDAAGLPAFGRGLLRVGGGELVEFGAGHAGAAFRPEPVVIIGEPGDPSEDAASSGHRDAPPTGCAVTQLDRAVEDITARHAAHRRPDAPWLEPLPVSLDEARRSEIGAGVELGERVALGVSDDPDRRAQPPLWWTPADQSLLIYGPPLRTARVLAGAAIAAMRCSSPADLHVFAITAEGRVTECLSGAPHSGGVVAPSHARAVARLLHRLELRDSSTPALVAIDGLDTVLDAVTEEGAHDLVARLGKLVSDGARLGVRIAATAAGPRAIPSRLEAAFSITIACDGIDDPLLGAAAAAGPLESSVDLSTGLEVSLIEPTWQDLEAVDLGPLLGIVGGPRPLATIPPVLWPCTLDAGVEHRGHELRVPIGLELNTGDAASLALTEASLVIGRPGTGRSATLAAMAEAIEGVQAFGGPMVRWWEAGRSAMSDIGPGLWLVDDAELLDDALGSALLERAREPDTWVVAAARGDSFRRIGWLHAARTGGVAALLQPGPGDIEAFGAPGGRARGAWSAGHGVTVHHGAVTEVQFACGRPTDVAGRPQLKRPRTG